MRGKILRYLSEREAAIPALGRMWLENPDDVVDMTDLGQRDLHPVQEVRKICHRKCVREIEPNVPVDNDDGKVALSAERHPSILAANDAPGRIEGIAGVEVTGRSLRAAPQGVAPDPGKLVLDLGRQASESRVGKVLDRIDVSIRCSESQQAKTLAEASEMIGRHSLLKSEPDQIGPLALPGMAEGHMCDPARAKFAAIDSRITQTFRKGLTPLRMVHRGLRMRCHLEDGVVPGVSRNPLRKRKGKQLRMRAGLREQAIRLVEEVLRPKFPILV